MLAIALILFFSFLLSHLGRVSVAHNVGIRSVKEIFGFVIDHFALNPHQADTLHIGTRQQQQKLRCSLRRLLLAREVTESGFACHLVLQKNLSIKGLFLQLHSFLTLFSSFEANLMCNYAIFYWPLPPKDRL